MYRTKIKEQVKIITVPDDKNIFVVGDIHGCYLRLIEELRKAKFNFKKDLCIGVGDLVDRGAKSRRAVGLIDEDWFESVLGNHEQFCIDGLWDYRTEFYHKQPNNGGAWFYELDHDTKQLIVDKFKQLPVALEVNWRGKKYGFVHADVPVHDWELLKELLINDDLMIGEERSVKDYCLWNRGLVRLPPEEAAKIHIAQVDQVFLGHTVTERVKHVGNCTFLDTGAVFGGGELTVIKLGE